MKTNLKALRKAAGWSNANDFAKSIGIPAKTYRNYEQGIRKMGLDVACDICNALGCEISELVAPPIYYGVVALEDAELLEDAEMLEGDDSLSDDEQELIDLYRSLPPKGKHAVLAGLRDFAEQ